MIHTNRIAPCLRLIVSFTLLFSAIAMKAQDWKPAGDRLKTQWAEEVSPENAWSEYPRPQLKRVQWKNLNGLWDYAIVQKGSVAPRQYDGKILVPYCIESSLSGVGRPLLPSQELWYRSVFNIPGDWRGQKILLHFGAVDWEMELYINGNRAGTHRGGSDPFSFDITRFLKNGKESQEIKVKVWDPTDTSIQPRGKQTLKPRGFWYTAVSGIWQTVWMEPVQHTFISSFHSVADIDKGQVTLVTTAAGLRGHERVKVRVTYKDKVVHSGTYAYKDQITLDIPDHQLWSPAFPNIYDVELELTRNDRLLDKVASYFAMRKISLGTDEQGYTKLFLNNEELFQFGTLDQGWWPDGLLTPPSDEAMKYDMEVVKSLGFNMIRKHIKVEPDRYYYHADIMGLLIWQDMPTGFLSIHHPEQHVKHDAEEDWARPAESAKQFLEEWKSIMDSKRFFPSVVVWVPFNEGWGQFDSKQIVNWTMRYDSTRLVDGISGWTDRGVGHMYDSHQYPGPGIEPAELNPGRAIVLGEFGGLGHPVEGHLWDPERNNWGYRTYMSQTELIDQYARLIHNVYPELARGLAAAIYTQTTDVEAEVNGILTYDRKVIKLPVAMASVLHAPLYSRNVKKATFIVPDSELTSREMAVSYDVPAFGPDGTPDSFGERPVEKVSGPVSVKKGGTVTVAKTFDLAQVEDHLAMKLYAVGDVTVYLNGVRILKKYVSTKRHYDDINLSEYTHLLRKGENTVVVTLSNIRDDSEFDFGFYTF